MPLPPASLPAPSQIKTVTFDELWKAFPREGRKDLLKTLQGTVPEKCPENDSAVRLSHALNLTGHPVGRSSLYTSEDVKDRDGNPVFIDPLQMKQFLESKWGKPRQVKGQEDVLSRKGILVFEGVKSQHNETCIDLWDGKTSALAWTEYWHESKDIWFFNMQH